MYLHCPSINILGRRFSTGVTDSMTSMLDETTKSPSIPDKAIPMNPKDDIDPYAKVTEVTVAINTTIAPKNKMTEASVTTGTRTKMAPSRTTVRATSAVTAPIVVRPTARNFTSVHAETPFPTTTMTRQDSRVSARTGDYTTARSVGEIPIQQLPNAMNRRLLTIFFDCCRGSRARRTSDDQSIRLVDVLRCERHSRHRRRNSVGRRSNEHRRVRASAKAEIVQERGRRQRIGALRRQRRQISHFRRNPRLQSRTAE